MEPADVKRLKALSAENTKLKKLLAERDLEIEVMEKEPIYRRTDGADLRSSERQRAAGACVRGRLGRVELHLLSFPKTRSS